MQLARRSIAHSLMREELNNDGSCRAPPSASSAPPSCSPAATSCSTSWPTAREATAPRTTPRYVSPTSDRRRRPGVLTVPWCVSLVSLKAFQAAWAPGGRRRRWSCRLGGRSSSARELPRALRPQKNHRAGTCCSSTRCQKQANIDQAEGLHVKQRLCSVSFSCLMFTGHFSSVD